MAICSSPSNFRLFLFFYRSNIADRQLKPTRTTQTNHNQQLLLSSPTTTSYQATSHSFKWVSICHFPLPSVRLTNRLQVFRPQTNSAHPTQWQFSLSSTSTSPRWPRSTVAPSPRWKWSTAALSPRWPRSTVAPSPKWRLSTAASCRRWRPSMAAPSAPSKRLTLADTDPSSPITTCPYRRQELAGACEAGHALAWADWRFTWIFVKVFLLSLADEISDAASSDEAFLVRWLSTTTVDGRLCLHY